MITFEDFFKSIRLFIPDDFKFKCQDCGNCCRHESGYVFLLDSEISKIEKKIKVSHDIFVKDFLIKFNNKIYSLKEKENFDCIFWDKKNRDNKGGCSIYKARPLQCQKFPFWISTFSNEENFLEQKRRCKGIMATDGKHFTKLQVYKYVYQDLVKRAEHYKSFLPQEILSVLFN